jgi:ribosomal protein S18 acetylase RimI-like enzyme
MRIRALVAADLPAVRALHTVCLKQALWLPPAAREIGPDEYEQAAIAATEQGLIAISDDGARLGFVAYQADERYIRNLYVSEHARKQGVGRGLLAALPPGPPWTLKCVEANIEALKFYDRLGWQRLDAGRSADGAWRRLRSPQGHP